STVQMPSGVPVATVAIDGAQNAALLAIQMLAINNEELTQKLLQYKQEMANAVQRKNDILQQSLNDK
ncbi:MAG: AIR carboxylase family protein, partial [Clostridiales bacterium]|nr:AIR carboxylase family protein [Clostridiales bacterium]